MRESMIAKARKRLGWIFGAALLFPVALWCVQRAGRSADPPARAFAELARPKSEIRRPASAIPDSLPSLRLESPSTLSEEKADARSGDASFDHAPSSPRRERARLTERHPAAVLGTPNDLSRSTLGGTGNAFHLIGGFVSAPKFGLGSGKAPDKGPKGEASSGAPSSKADAGHMRVEAARFAAADAKSPVRFAAANGARSAPLYPAGGASRSPSYSRAGDATSSGIVSGIGAASQEAGEDPAAGAEPAGSGASAADSSGPSAQGSSDSSSSDCGSAATSEASAGADGAAIVSQGSMPSTVNAKQTYQLAITVRNSGSSTWTSSAGYELGAKDLSWGLCHVWLDAGEAVAPGDEKTFSIALTAPAVSGTYDMQWRMRQGSQWFGDASSNSAVTVR